MLEVEIKARVYDLEYVKNKLSLLGFKYVGKFFEKDYYYNHPCKDFKETDEALRIRICNGKLSITYKGRKLDERSKTRIEYTSIADENIFKIVEALGFKLVAVVEKFREVFKKDNIKICIDNVKNLGTFVEIESDKYDLDLLFNIAKELNLKEFTRKSYLEMILEKNI